LNANLGSRLTLDSRSGEELASRLLRLLVPSGGLVGGLVWQSARGTVVPWVVEIDKRRPGAGRCTGCRRLSDHRLGGLDAYLAPAFVALASSAS